jgi:hypothetical protein
LITNDTWLYLHLVKSSKGLRLCNLPLLNKHNYVSLTLMLLRLKLSNFLLVIIVLIVPPIKSRAVTNISAYRSICFKISFTFQLSTFASRLWWKRSKQRVLDFITLRSFTMCAFRSIQRDFITVSIRLLSGSSSSSYSIAHHCLLHRNPSSAPPPSSDGVVFMDSNVP